MAVADSGNGNDQGENGHGCRASHISGTVAPQTFTLTVTRAEGHGSISAGSTVTFTIGGTGQTVRANVSACSGSTGTTTSSTLTVRSVDLKAFETSTTETTTTGTDDNDQGDHNGDHHHGTTTSSTTTTTHS
jgi:hypothetical protein